MKRSLAASTMLLLLCAGCKTQQPWRPTVDTFGSSRSQYVSRDMEECRQLAFQVSGSAPQQAVQGAVTGGLVGAAAGAAIGAAFGSAGRGAAVGAAAGGIGMGASRASQAEQAYQRAYVNCMRQRGHNVLN
jgi:outer membrane lipoprotein SlyB